jgi:alkylated DNA repair dioxygenase AlkB
MSYGGIPVPVAGVTYYPDFLTVEDADELFERLQSTCRWKQLPVRIFGRDVLQPRLTGFYAGKGVRYVYSGLKLEGGGWTRELDVLRQKVESCSGETFNSALLNLYRTGRDYMGWHRDNESALGKNPAIASVSLGAPRKFQLREYDTKTNLVTLELSHGSLLLMKGESQHRWEHRLPKAPQVNGQRINITFRRVLT